MKQRWPAPERNKEPILSALRELLSERSEVLEVAAGSGQHAAHFARAQPGWRWLPTDPDPEHLASISAYVEDVALENLSRPVRLDVLNRPWDVASVDVVYCANMIHIAPWECGRALIEGSANILRPGGLLVLYGPYRIDGEHTSESNVSFDKSLRARDPAWGVRDLRAVDELAVEQGFEFVDRVAMPANNQLVSWRLAGGLE